MQIDHRDYQLQVAQANSKVIQAKGQLKIVQKLSHLYLDTSTSITNRYIKLYKYDADSLQDAQKYIN